MIVCRKPWTVYDVDVIGTALLLVFGAAVCLGVAIPAGENTDQYRQTLAVLAVEQSKVEQASARLCRLNAEVERLEAGVAGHVRLAPRRGALTPFLRRVASMAKECGLEITQVLPQPVQRAEGCLVGEVRYVGRGAAIGFARFLDRLAKENPYCSLEDYFVARNDVPGGAGCRLRWALRLYMLEDDSANAR